ncbi:MAG: response regulator [Myxococcota bacterium]
MPANDTSAMDIAAMDISTMDISTMDISSPNISSTDISRTDISRTDISRTDISRTDIPEPNDTILVVDDDLDLLRALSRILRREGHHVIAASDGWTAVELARQHHPSLAIVDYAMPGMDGEMVLAEIRRELRENSPPAVLLTASGNQQARAQQIGAVLGLCKPFRVEELLVAIELHKALRNTS